MRRRRMKASRGLVRAVYESPLKQYQIAQVIGLHPCTISSLLRGIRPVYEGDERLIRIGTVVGIPAADCFEDLDLPGADALMQAMEKANAECST